MAALEEADNGKGHAPLLHVDGSLVNVAVVAPTGGEGGEDGVQKLGVLLELVREGRAGQMRAARVTIKGHAMDAGGGRLVVAHD